MCPLSGRFLLLVSCVFLSLELKPFRIIGLLKFGVLNGFGCRCWRKVTDFVEWALLVYILFVFFLII